MKIKINNKFFLYFNSFAVSKKLDSVASCFSFVAKFDPTILEHRILFKPLSYPEIQIYTDSGKLLLTGEITNHDFNSESSPGLVQVSGYSKGGMLEDVTIPLTAYPLENLNSNLKDISNKLLGLYGLNLIVDESVSKEVGLNYEKTVAESTEDIKSYLCKLAGQRNIVMSHDVYGNIIYFRPNTNAKSKHYFTEENTIKMSLSVDGQSMHSDISVIRQPSMKNSGAATNDGIKNGQVKRFRPTVQSMSSGEDTDTSKAVKNALASELAGISLTIEFDRWLEDIECGDIVEVHNHEIYLMKRIRFMVMDIDYNQNEKENTMSLKLVLPEAFSGETPKNIFDYDNAGKNKERHG